ncbi:MAG: single-stranded-DNA-specific exonuclease RecJ [Alphaproteobacteria bacterium]|nr:single-stranded-DNA-specific exonuclease RecJ [Alphaproteobacteria bacterium]
MTAAAFAGIERSALGRRWCPRAVDFQRALGFAQRVGVSEAIARILLGRGVAEADAAAFLDPRLRDLLPDPSHLKDMDKAVARIVAAIEAGEMIAVFGDYDVDGATSAALLHAVIGGAGGRVRHYIPDRMREGYGPNAPALLKLGEEGARIVITVDCGTTAHAPLEAAAAAGIDVVVVDHHAAEAGLPPAFAIVNPNRIDETSDQGKLAAVGVSFLLAVAINRALRQRGRPTVELLECLDLVALGTVCDVVPLVGLNRAFVAQGLKAVRARTRIGIAALADVAGVQERVQAFHLGFALGPRVNAGGRVGEADLGVRLLTTGDPTEAAEIAKRLDGYNRERQRIEADVLASALAQAEANADRDLVFVAGEGWHPGVIGIVASRLKERFERPALVIALDGAQGKGSARSAFGWDIGAAVIAARGAGLLVNGGGHANAAGLTVAAGGLEPLRGFLSANLGAHLENVERRTVVEYDGALPLSAATAALVEELERVGPYGVGNPEPRFVFNAVRVAKADIVGTSHIRCFLEDSRGVRLSAIAFRAVGTGLSEILLRSDGSSVHLLGRLKLDSWRGASRVQLQIEDAAAV